MAPVLQNMVAKKAILGGMKSDHIGYVISQAMDSTISWMLAVKVMVVVLIATSLKHGITIQVKIVRIR